MIEQLERVRMTEQYLIWSHEHGQWWAPNSQGYTSDIDHAGRYSKSEAAEITVGHIPPGEEVAVLEVVAENHGNRIIWGIKP